MMKWVLVTGGVCSGIGKGCLAAMLARHLMRGGLQIAYQKLEPCLQGDIAALPNTCFGEIVRNQAGAYFDGDVARAAFYAPGFVPGEASDTSLGRLLSALLPRVQGVCAPRLHELDAMLRDLLPASTIAIVEVGGTAGELEHRILCEALRRALGLPLLHVHLTALMHTPGGRITSKPAQISLDALTIAADLILVRGAGEQQDVIAPLQSAAGIGVPVVPIPEDVDWPERSFAQALRFAPVSKLLTDRLSVYSSDDLLFGASTGDSGRVDVFIVHDGAGVEGYASLAHRLRSWSKDRVRMHWQTHAHVPPTARGIIRIGERTPVPVHDFAHTSVLNIVPIEEGHFCRDLNARADWQGTADTPEGAVARWLEPLLASHSASLHTVALAYSNEDFAARYLAASAAGALRDHVALDDLVARALPAGERLQRARILDVGTGSGRWAARLIAAGAREVVGVEPAPPMASAAAALKLERFKLHVCPIEHYEPEGAFDAVLACMSLDHVEDLAPVLTRLAEHIVPHGRFIIATEHPLRTAVADGLRWISEGQGMRSARLRDYGRLGKRRFYWFGHPSVVEVMHRPMGEWVRILRAAGLELVAVHEPVSSDAADAGNPRFWMVVARRPGPLRRLVTIDGGAATGKTCLAEGLAGRLGWKVVDTGQIQRAFAYRLIAGTPSAPVDIIFEKGLPRYLVGARDVTDELAGDVVAQACPEVARDAGANAEIAVLIENLTRDPCIVTGRAMGRSFDDPLVRFFLVAPTEVRAARRRCTANEIEERDRRDIENGRLLPPDIDAIVLDSAARGQTVLIEEAMEFVRRRLA